MYVFEILENECIRKGLDPLGMSFDDIVREAGGIIFDFDYDLYDENYKPVLEKKFFLRNYEKQIGFETIFSFKREIRRRLAEILPKYNRLYQQDEKKLDYFIGQLTTDSYKRNIDELGGVDSTDNTDRSRKTLRDLESDQEYSASGGDLTEECNKTSDLDVQQNDGKIASESKEENENTMTYKDRPEDGKPGDLKYATNTTHTKSKGKSYDDLTFDTSKTTNTRSGSHGIKRAGANFNDSKTGTKTGESEEELAGSQRKYDSSTTNNIEEDYILTRTNNNADKVLQRISYYINNYKDTDMLVLDHLDPAFSSLWGW